MNVTPRLRVGMSLMNLGGPSLTLRETSESYPFEVRGGLALRLLGGRGLLVAELDHAYIWTDDILYGPPHPGPLWNAQLEALSLEAEKRHGVAFLDLSRADQESLVRRQIPNDLPPGLPDPARAPHVALGLLAYFYQTSEANDLCYEARIERFTCRGLESSSSEPPRRS